MADKTTTSYAMLDFGSEICKGNICQLNFKYCKSMSGFATYDVQLPGISLTNFPYHFQA